jgi:asparagine synthase (glutamine-hydrolysing)
MCGICGIFDSRRRLAPIAAMNDLQRHRGPDDEGYLFVNTATGDHREAAGPDTEPSLALEPRHLVRSDSFDLVLASRRLAVLDLSASGHMPLSRDRKSLWIVFNGEIYNYREIREELRALGHSFQSETDTEVILAAYQQWGPACLERFNGMFAFALWDARRRVLFCARDRFGVKPFYYRWEGAALLFASEIKSLLAHPAVPRRPNDSAVYDYLVLCQSDHSEQSFFEGIAALSPGHFLLFDPSRGQLSVNRWWSLELNPALESAQDDQRVYDEFGSLLEDAVRLRLRSDVPIGSCLSGGLDSSSVVCLANRLLRTEGLPAHRSIEGRQKTFTARNAQQEIDEYRYSHLVVERTNVEENLVLPSGERLWEEVRSFVWHMDEPVDSTSQYPQWNVMRLARSRGVTVLLDGQGGDEVLAGYYSYWPLYLRQLRRAKGAAAFSRGAWHAVRVGGKPVADVLYQSFAQQLPWRLQQVVRTLRPFKTGPGQGGSGLQQWQVAPEFLARFSDRQWRPRQAPEGTGLAGILYQDLVSVNLPKLLRYEDRNSMAFSLETRLPFLDYRLVEAVYALPLDYRIRNGWNKWILRKSMSGVLPPEIAWRRSKLGFPVPERTWLQAGAALIRETLRAAARRTLDAYVPPHIVDRICALDDAALAAAPGVWRLVNLALWFELFLSEPRPDAARLEQPVRSAIAAAVQ